VRWRRIAIYAAGALALWGVALLIIGALFGGPVGDRVSRRIAGSLLAQATLGGSDLALVRGWLELDALKVRKDDVGTLAVDVDTIRCELPPFGGALISRTCRDLVIRGVRLDVSSLEVFRLRKPKRTPFRVHHVDLTDAVLTFAPSAFVPDLGKIQIRLDHVEAGATTFKTPLSWVFAMKELRATLDLPANIVVTLAYQDGVLTAAGGIFGSAAVRVPVEIPVADAADDAQAEIKKLVAFGRELAERLVARRAQDWLRSKLSW
jgi:hypothetical protein